MPVEVAHETVASNLVGYYYPIDFFQKSEDEIRRWASSIVLQIIRIVEKTGGDNEWTQQRQASILIQVRKFLGTTLTAKGKYAPNSVLGRLERWVAENVLAAFSAGAGTAGDELYLAGVESFYKLNEPLIQASIFDTFQSVAQSVEHAEKDLGRRLNEWKYNTLRARVKAAVLSNIVAGQSPFLTGRELATALKKDGIMGFTDKAGKKWNLESYAAMAVRTKLKENHTAGFLDHYQSIATIPKLVDIQDTPYTSHAGPKDPCWPYQKQRFWALNQADATKYDLPLLRTAPPWHPNCEHILRAYVPESVQDQKKKDQRLKRIQKRHASIRERVRAGELTEQAASKLLMRGLKALGAEVSE